MPDPIERVRQTVPGHRVHLELSAADLQALARAYLDRQADLDIREVKVEIVAPDVIVRGVTALLGRDVTLAVAGTPAARDRRVAIDLRRIDLNGAPAPKFAVAEIGAFLQKKFSSPKLLLDVEEVTVQSGIVQIVGYRTQYPDVAASS